VYLLQNLTETSHSKRLFQTHLGLDHLEKSTNLRLGQSGNTRRLSFVTASQYRNNNLKLFLLLLHNIEELLVEMMFRNGMD